MDETQVTFTPETVQIMREWAGVMTKFARVAGEDIWRLSIAVWVLGIAFVIACIFGYILWCRVQRFDQLIYHGLVGPRPPTPPRERQVRTDFR